MISSRVVGRIALLVYILGGIVVTSFHRHGSCGPCAVVCVRGESQSSQSSQADPSNCDHSHVPASHSSHSHAFADSLRLASLEGSLIGSSQDLGRCGEDCVACLFSTSGQTLTKAIDWELVNRLHQDRSIVPNSLLIVGAKHRPGIPRGPPSDASIVR